MTAYLVLTAPIVSGGDVEAPGSAFASGCWSSVTAPRNDERIDELKLSRSRALLMLLAEAWSGELPFKRCDGSAGMGFGPRGGDEPEPMVTSIERWK